MIVFHAAWDPESERLHLWAENTENYKGSYRRILPAGKEKAPVHPFALGRAALAQYAASFSAPETLARASASKLVLSLPSRTKGPLPSEESGLQAYAPEEKPFLKNWEAGTLAVEAGHAAGFFLREFPQKSLPAMKFSASFLFAQEVVAHARDQSILRSPVLAQWKEKMPGGFQSLAVPAGAGRLRPEFLAEDFFEKMTKARGNDGKTLVFQLEPFKNPEDGWRILFFLQPFKDRSLFVPAENIWRRKNEKWSVEFFSELREAARVCPLLEPALKTELPGGLSWTEEQVYLFCNRDEPKLRENGFGVVFPQGKPGLAVPGTFTGELRPYQQYGVSWLRFLESRNLGACLADDMGLGKTVQVIALIAATARPGFPTLVICPMSVAGNWQKEFERFAPSLKVRVHHGGQRLSQEAFGLDVLKLDAVITTYSLARRDTEALQALPWGRIILDEAQNIKNEKSLQAQAVKRLKAPGRIALTGTPVENRLSDLWSIMDFLNPGMFGSAQEFKERYALPIEKQGDGERAEALRDKIAPLFLRRLKTDKTIIQDLPEKMEMKVFCSLTGEQAGLYEHFLTGHLEKIKSLEGIERKGQILAALTKLKQICNHPAHFLKEAGSLEDRSGKLNRLVEMLEEAASEGDKALVFTQFTEMGGLLKPFLAEKIGCPVLYFHGGTSMQEREKLVAEFQSGIRGPAVFILSLKAGGTGLNLTAAQHVFHFDRWWNPAVENQATDRAFRIGQQRNVQVYKLISLGTLEERIDRMLEEKRDLAGQITGGGEDWLTEMRDEQIEELFRLKTEKGITE